MKKHQDLEALLEANPRAKAQEALVREALELLRDLRKGGVQPKDYDLMPAFGERHQLRSRTPKGRFSAI